MNGIVKLSILIAGIGVLSGCQTLELHTASEPKTSATITDPVLFGDARIAVSINKKIYQGSVGKLSDIAVGDISKQFDWNPDHEHRNIKQEMAFLFGTTILRADDATTIQCKHLKHGDDWRLLCTNPKGEQIGLLQAKKGR
ncbi:MAG: hypothetical protein ACK5ZW_07485 [Betaproteobacteria bacterium]|jgi:hypothetical protein